MLDRMLRIETEAGEALEQRGNGDLRLGAGKRRPQAEMRSSAKGEMAGVAPLDIKTVRLGVPRWVAPGRENRDFITSPAFTSVPPISSGSSAIRLVCATGGS